MKMRLINKLSDSSRDARAAQRFLAFSFSCVYWGSGGSHRRSEASLPGLGNHFWNSVSLLASSLLSDRAIFSQNPATPWERERNRHPPLSPLEGKRRVVGASREGSHCEASLCTCSQGGGRGSGQSFELRLFKGKPAACLRWKPCPSQALPPGTNTGRLNIN